MVIADVDETAAQQAAQRLQLEGVAASAFRCDVGQKDEVQPPPPLPALRKLLLPGSAGCAGVWVWSGWARGICGQTLCRTDCGLRSWQKQPPQPWGAVGRGLCIVQADADQSELLLHVQSPHLRTFSILVAG